MKLLNVQNNVRSEGELSHQRYDVKFSAKMASILSDHMYNNKIRAVIRELSTNAWDSHIAVGNSKPFDIHLPTTYEPYFYIRDYGEGMSKNRFNKIYLTYGESDKEDSNDFTGCLGLGSKTPFCYHTRTAMVEVWYNGYKRIYNLYIDDENMPCGALVSESVSDEPNGVKIQIPVTHYDFYNFEEEAEYVYRHFNVKPNFIGKKLTVNEYNYLITGTNWSFRDNGEPSTVIMGNVCYPLNANTLGFKDATDPRYHIASKGFDIKINIGDVDIQPSREGLSYNDLTKARCKNYIETICREISAQIESKIQSASSLWDARCKFNAIKKELGQLAEYVDTTHVNWQGQSLGLLVGGNLDIKDEMPKYTNTLIKRVDYNSWRKKLTHNECKSVITPRSKIVVNDLKIGIVGRMDLLTQESKHTTYYITQTTPDQAELDQLLEFLGCNSDDVTLGSTLPAPVRNANHSSGNGVRKMTKVTKFQVNTYLYDKPSNNWKNTTVNLDDGGVYVDFHRYAVMKDGKVFNSGELKNTLNKLNSLFGVDIPDIYGIRKCDVDNLEGEWINIFDWIEEQYSIITKKENISIDQIISYQSEIVNANNFRFNKSTTCYYPLTAPELIEFSSPSISQFIADYKKAKKAIELLDKAEFLRYIEETLGINRPASVVENLDLVGQLDRIKQRYPMLSFLSKTDGYKSVVSNYIDLVENSYVSV